MRTSKHVLTGSISRRMPNGTAGRDGVEAVRSNALEIGFQRKDGVADRLKSALVEGRTLARGPRWPSSRNLPEAS